MKTIPNILAERYTSTEMQTLWSPENRVILERQFWIAVMKEQKALGLDVAEGAIEAYEAVVGVVDLQSIADREAVTRHDVKARIEEFCDLAGFQEIHKGMTSRDLTENVEQMQVFRSLKLIQIKAAAALGLLAKKALEYRDIVLTARTHNVPAQMTTLGARLSMFGEELMCGLRRLSTFIDNYTFRGLKGASGTQSDLLRLFKDDAKKVRRLELGVMQFLGGERCFRNTGQVYPRSLDFEVVSVLAQLSSAPTNFSNTLRLMAGYELASEGFAKGQVGSSAMPHKMNARSCERIKGFHTLMKGYVSMAADLSGGQWNEGDVSCSVVRRVLLPDSFFVMDGLLETFITILNQMDVFEKQIEGENERNLPFLLTIQVLMEAVRMGVWREEAHEVIKKHSTEVIRGVRVGEMEPSVLIERLGAAPELKLGMDGVREVYEKGRQSVGLAKEQVERFVHGASNCLQAYPDSGGFVPSRIL